MRVAFVTPRYGPDVMGGAETAARQLAEHLVADLGWEVEAYSTCALDHITWDNVLPPGDSVLGGVRVHRFPAVGGRPPDFYALDGRLRVAPAAATARQADRWVDLNGPVTPALVDALGSCQADVVAFYPYLHYPVVRGIQAVRAPAVLHPAAHDEPAFYLPVFRSTYAAADALCYHTLAERRLVQRVHRVADRFQMVLGLGVGEPVEGGRAGGELLGIGDRPYVVSVGRVDEHKGSAMLAAFFRRYKEQHPGPLALALVGPVSARLPDHPDIVVTGVVDEPDKWDLVRDATVAVSPSALESFSLVVLEAWAERVPVVVNATCDPTREHCQRSGGGLWFGSYRQFEAVLDRLMGDPALRRRLGERGRAYVDHHYQWPALIRRYARFVTAVAERGRTVPVRSRPVAGGGRTVAGGGRTAPVRSEPVDGAAPAR
ncbi:MAG: glycosyltransferase family 4 protein [Acidimicrobiales bacterium]